MPFTCATPCCATFDTVAALIEHVTTAHVGAWGADDVERLRLRLYADILTPYLESLSDCERYTFIQTVKSRWCDGCGGARPCYCNRDD